MPGTFRSFACAIAWSVTAVSASAIAQVEDPNDIPVLIEAESLNYDEALQIVIAAGEVEIIDGDSLLRADRVVYNQRSGVAAASGNVVLVDAEGNVLFANYMELDDGLAEGFLEQANMLFADDSRLVANSGVRREDRYTTVDNAVYSPCLLCVADDGDPPIWQIRAAQVTHDSENKTVTYKDAFFDFRGVPVLYTPYFSHVDPSVERRTGFLTPTFGTTTALGPFLRNYFYVDISPEQDATIEATLTRDSGILAGLEYRRRFENGRIELSGSVNRSDRTDEVDGVEFFEENESRGHLFGEARFDLSDHWRTGADIALVSDDTYLSTFEISDEDVLRSTGFVEGFYGPSYVAVEAFSFRDVRLIDGQRQPIILPIATADLFTEPDAVMGGQVRLEGSALNIRRDFDSDNTDSDINGVDTRRLSLSGAWFREDIFSTGLVTNFETSLRGDLYDSNDIPDPDDSTVPLRDETAGRIIPRATVSARYPFVRNSPTSQQIVEPIVSVTAAPSINNGSNIPNNDSRDLEFDEVNLFEDSRFPGIDVENGGARVAYGLGFSHFGTTGATFDGFLGQSIQLIDDEEFSEGSGLEGDLSDVVGRLSFRPSRLLDLAWRFRLDEDELEWRRHEIRATSSFNRFSLSANYNFLDAVAGSDSDTDREEITLRADWRINDRWTATSSIRRDLEESESRNASIGFRYGDCCLTFTAQLRRDFTNNRDANDGTSVFFTLGLQNIGQLPLELDNAGF